MGHTIRDKVGTSGWVSVELLSIQSLSSPSSIVFPLFSQNAGQTSWKKNQTSKVTLCSKHTGSLKSLCWKHFSSKIRKRLKDGGNSVELLFNSLMNQLNLLIWKSNNGKKGKDLYSFHERKINEIIVFQVIDKYYIIFYIYFYL